jgi:hypothetical protein
VIRPLTILPALLIAAAPLLAQSGSPAGPLPAQPPPARPAALARPVGSGGVNVPPPAARTQ